MKQRAILSVLSLTTVLGASSLASAQHARTPTASVNARGDRERAPQRFRLDGSLSERDRADDEGRHRRTRRITLHRGDRVTFSLSSEQFDTVARVEGPGEGAWQDDDGAGEGTNSLLRFVAPQDGAYTFIATSYEPNETGRFDAVIEIRPGAAPRDDGWDDDRDDDSPPRAEEREDAPSTEPAAAQGSGRTFGIFVGISDYQGENDNLAGSAADAVQLARAFQQAGWMERSNAVVLTDREATADNVRQAFRTIAPRVGANDTFVFFFDGHGASSVIDLRGPDLSRNELGRLMDRVHGRQLLVLDSCSSGGFEPIVRGRANRAGLFSSRANETSSTAPEVGAGGWLAYAFREAVAGGVQRRDDGSLDFDEVVTYVRAQYRRHDVDQNLVAVNGGRGDFAIGGAGDAARVPSDTAVASNDPGDGAGDDAGDVTGEAPTGALPSLIPMIPGFLNGARRPAANPGARPLPGVGPLFGSNDQFAAILGTGMRVAGQVLDAVTK